MEVTVGLVLALVGRLLLLLLRSVGRHRLEVLVLLGLLLMVLGR